LQTDFTNKMSMITANCLQNNIMCFLSGLSDSALKTCGNDVSLNFFKENNLFVRDFILERERERERGHGK